MGDTKKLIAEAGEVWFDTSTADGRLYLDLVRRLVEALEQSEARSEEE